MTLQELRPGQSARIDHVDARQPGVVRLMVLGLIEGVEVQHANSAIGGDPIEISVFGTSISVRKQQASCFKISPVSAND
jgi:Fe2+ transport system protein FeoA